MTADVRATDFGHRCRMGNRLPAWCRDTILLGEDAPVPIDRPFTAAYAASVGVGSAAAASPGGGGAAATRAAWGARRDAGAGLAAPARECASGSSCRSTPSPSTAWRRGSTASMRCPAARSTRCRLLDVFSRAGSRMRRDSIRSGVRDLTAAGRLRHRRTAGDQPAAHCVRPRSPAVAVRRAGRDRRLPAAGRRPGRAARGGRPVQGFPRRRPAAPARPARRRRRRVAARERAAAALARGGAALAGRRRSGCTTATSRASASTWVTRGSATEPSTSARSGTTRTEREHDEGRIRWLEDERDWVMDVFLKHDVYGQELARPAAATRVSSARAGQLGLRGTTYIDLGR